jgi:hypothetical protein
VAVIGAKSLKINKDLKLHLGQLEKTVFPKLNLKVLLGITLKVL